MFETKAFYLSKTVIVAVLQFVVGILVLIQGQTWIAEWPAVVAFLLMAKSVLDVIIRQLTAAGVRWINR